MNKKAGIPDAIFYLVAMFAVAIIFFVGYLVLVDIDDNFQNSNTISDQGKNMMSNLKGKYVTIIDNAFLMLFVGILIATGVGVWFIRTHPALFWITIPMFAFIIFLAAIYANVFYNFTNNDKIAENVLSTDFTIIRFIMEHYVHVITVAIIFIAILLFAKGKREVI